MTDSQSQPNPEKQSGRPPVNGHGAVTPPVPPAGMPQVIVQQPKEKSGWFRKLIGSLFVFSLLLNFYLFWIVSATLQSGPSEKLYSAGDRSMRIVMIPIEGTVDGAMYKFVHESLSKLENNLPSALVLRVNSGGGAVSASDQIWHEVKAFKEKHNIPVIASFGGVAASGAYYISAPSDVIVIERTGITGSIGVIAQGFTVNELLGKIGVTPEIVTSTESVDKDELSPFREWTPKDREIITALLDNAYDQFVEVVYQGREKIEFDGKTYGLTKEDVQDLATGRVFTAKEALDSGLVDAIGYLDEAIEIAKKKAGMPVDAKPEVTRMTRATGGLFSLLGASSPSILSMGAEDARSWVNDMSQIRLAYQMKLN